MSELNETERADYERLLMMERRLHELLAQYESTGLLSATRVRKAVSG